MPAQHLPYMVPLSNMPASEPHYREDSPPNCKNSRLSPPMQESILQQSEECLQSSVVDSMSQLPSDNIIGNPKVILPPNMTTTILTLAALGTKVTASPASTKAGSTPGTPSSPQETSNQKLLINASNAIKDQKPVPIDYSRYVKRFSSALECGSNYCKDLNYREHFHCLDCNSKVFVKKEEMIRHFKWHKKRDESLQHGFMRYSPMDDCSDKFSNCTHNRKQTHYHCLKFQVILPPNMTTTILTLAALGTKVTASPASTKAGSTPGTPSSPQETSNQKLLINASNAIKDQKPVPIDYSRYVKRFSSALECGSNYCKDLNYREHFHCLDCNSKVFVKKEEMIRHFKWHKKRDESLQHGFMRYSPMDDCSDKFSNCTHNRKQTHYHCLKEGCDRVYVSTSDVQMHANYHRKVSAIIQEGFQRFRATEDCASKECSFYGQRTTHFHCRRPGCSFTFKNKADMEKHKTYHIKDEQLNKDGFKKFMKQEHCTFENCRFSKVCNHIHCIRPGEYGVNDICKSECEYICKEHYHCKTDNCNMVFKGKDILGVQEHARTGFAKEGCTEVISSNDKPFRRLDHYKIHEYSRKINFSHDQSPLSMSSSIDGVFKRKRGRPPKNRIIEFPMSSTSCQLPQAIYTSFKLPKPSSQQQPISFGPFSPTSVSYTGIHPPTLLPKTTNSISLLAPPTSSVALLTSISPPFVSLPTSGNNLTLPMLNQSVGIVDQKSVDDDSILHHSPTETGQLKQEIQEGFYAFPDNTPCPDEQCMFYGQHHFHCTQPRCFYVTDRSDILLLHSKDFHDNIDIMEGYVFYDWSVDCQYSNCPSNKVNRHFHCTRPNCNYSFVRYSTMSLHEQKHRNISPTPKKQHLSSSDDDDIKSPVTTVLSSSGVISSINFCADNQPKTSVVRASGTFYPLSAFSTSSLTTGTSVPTFSSNTIFSETDKGKDKSFPSMSPKPDHALTKLLQQPGPNIRNSFQGTEKHIQYGPTISCGRPFCKLKKKEHFHCNVCNQTFSNFLRLKPHVTKHCGAVSPVPIYCGSGGSPESPPSATLPGEDGLDEREGTSDDDDEGKDEQCNIIPDSSYHEANILDSSRDELKIAMPSLYTWQAMTSGSPSITLQSPPSYANSVEISDAHLSNSFINRPSSFITQATSDVSKKEKFYGSPQVDFNAHMTETDCMDQNKLIRKRTFPEKRDDVSEPKKIKLTSLRILKDEPVPSGYVRYRFNEDCGYSFCGYREHQTHFHCMRKDCGYSFCDKTRFVQHTARHERLDTLMGGDFQQYRSNVNCGRSECIYANTLGAMANKSSHFHCIKCDFVCTDTNKVVAHRRQHTKMDSISAAGFEKFTQLQNCNVQGCNHNQRQTHYHCLKCQYAVLGLSQMSSHKYRHME
ncbi:zinc finger protein castor homolog 1-like [Centruroides sculpturatus]|uniref:zinc finger protein castor homolog 1-like n=1 Tax=Centruroides sculpturatus TaxID=218467 RepID=UPI000C6D7834|nr:zinc finger protein castor homolog 1-like [Centruroides sculpturatus]